MHFMMEMAYLKYITFSYIIYGIVESWVYNLHAHKDSYSNWIFYQVCNIKHMHHKYVYYSNYYPISALQKDFGQQ